ncbi:hypothetical protein EDD21DRAFT_440602 [Dissophora ornata]|nr:hypothetical protein BGZ58_002745 [Dissophora ornata]KAI8605119.1 hypothetical protein EDD21DRAFT_440602 [Dissophora ornata]
MIHVPHVDYTAVVAGAAFNQVIAAIIYGPLFGRQWLAAMKKDRNGDQWMGKHASKSFPPGLFFYEFLLNLCKAWVTGLFLNLTQAQTMSQAAQLGTLLFVGIIFTTVTSELMWEKRTMDLQWFKYMSGFVSTVLMCCVMHIVGTA